MQSYWLHHSKNEGGLWASIKVCLPHVHIVPAELVALILEQWRLLLLCHRAQVS